MLFAVAAVACGIVPSLAALTPRRAETREKPVDGDPLVTYIYATEAARAALERIDREMINTVEQAIAAGGIEWKAGDKHRVYFNNVPTLVGLVVFRYGASNISSVQYRGEKVSNTKGRALVNRIETAKVWFDAQTGLFATVGLTDAELQLAVAAITARLAA